MDLDASSSQALASGNPSDNGFTTDGLDAWEEEGEADPLRIEGGRERVESESSSTGAVEGPESPRSVSEHEFREIVDDLTMKNQELRSRLRHYEAQHLPPDLYNDRLFEVRFFEGLPALKLTPGGPTSEQKRELEEYLQTYVQNYHLPSGEGGPPGDDASNTNSTSSLGGTLRSLRSSEKAALGWTGGGIVSDGGGTSGPQPHRSDTRSGSNSSEEAAPLSTRKSTSPLGNPPSHPPPILRPLPPRFPTFDAERSLLASASNSGFEPPSISGTGTGMKPLDPSKHRSSRHHPPSPVLPLQPPHPPSPPPISPPPPPRAPGESSGTDTSSSSTGSSPSSKSTEREAALIACIETLFRDSLPASSSPPSSSPPPPTTDPVPLPPSSSSNTRYLRALLAPTPIPPHHSSLSIWKGKEQERADEGASRWIYLNLVLTMAVQLQISF
ncbi:hypothetical protein MNV49_005469 [Pseudohyphozyma bogoriensis]|nr:hypothetical protein MNV49_005469 [Pseudohyphozyma bogoriensis]